MPLQATSGAASYDAFGGGVAAVPQYIEDVFSTYLYTGNGSTQTITNGIDLSTKGGLVWSKSRSTADNNVLLDTVRGANSILVSNTTAAASISGTPYVTATTTGYSIGTSNSQINGSGNTYASWTFREQPKFFDVVTYTGNGDNARAIAHSLASTPGCVIVKRTDAAGENWNVWHRDRTGTNILRLNLTNAFTSVSSVFPTNPDATYFYPGSNSGSNASGGTYVAYLFAHNAGGFGLTGTDNVISCGSFTTDGAGGASVSLGYEPQWLLTKRSDSIGTWIVTDTMRGWSYSNGLALRPNTSDAENNYWGTFNQPNATGFTIGAGAFGAGETYIYIAIRRGPMKVPTSGTSVYNAVTYSGTGATRVLDASIVPDIYMGNTRTPTGGPIGLFVDRLRGDNTSIQTTSTGAESTVSPTRYFSGQTGLGLDTTADNVSGRTYVSWFMRRAPNFFDEVCYTGTGAGQVVSHNLGVVPQLMIFKCRSTAGTGWIVTNAFTGYMSLNLTTAQDSTTPWDFNGTAPTATQLTTRAASNGSVNAVGSTYVAYLFATCAGVSKVGSYTGNGSSQTINCGFTSGARFVLIKRTDSTGDWYVWDTARGIVTANDPHLSLNTTAAEVTTDDTIDTDSTGFVVNQVTATNVNVSSATYIFLAIA